MRNRSSYSARLLCGTAMAVVTMTAAPAFAEGKAINIEPQSLATALREFASQSQQAILVSPALADNKTSQGVHDATDPEIALAQLLQGTGLTYRRSGEALLIVSASDPQSGSAAGAGADAGTVQALIVTAQKREEDIQDVPIAISAFTQEDLTRSQVAGGPDLVTQVPNFTFTKTNFSSYSIQIRGIGTQAISATTDPAVAVAFNNTPFIRNRFFEQEFYDLERVEVLRGPQGTLYGRNATGGVVNIISAKPAFRYEAKLSADLGNYNSSRLEGMLNIPIVEDKVALRVAGAWTKRDGYATNQITGNPIDGRDLWSTRVSLRVRPNDRINANLVWEHFQESDDRLRSGKQLCKKDVVTQVGPFQVGYLDALPNSGFAQLFSGVQATFSQGCTRNSLYDPNSFETPNGLMLPYYQPLSEVGLPAALTDPYLSTAQSKDLRVIQSNNDPKYTASDDLGELQLSFDLANHLTLSSETGYSIDSVYSLEDFNRFNTAPGAWSEPDDSKRPGVLQQGPNGGIFCDPQLGCSDRLVAVDISSAKSSQFSQELRLASDFSGPFNFSVGANFLRADSIDKYYVFINSLSLISAYGVDFGGDWASPYVGGQSDNTDCLPNGYLPGDPNGAYPVVGCVYMDPNPINRVNDQGHNYFLSKNPYKLISYAMFGEAYYQVADNLKLTGGLRWTVDKKQAPRIPTWILATQTVGYPVADVINQKWSEPTGRLAIDWKPELPFTDQTLLYASFAHGYKAGGANPPGFVRTFYAHITVAEAAAQQSTTRPRTFQPEFVNAWELGAKNTFDEGRATLNLAAFYYDYTGYQVSEIVDRSAYNRNFDATVWGAELESEWHPLENLKLGFKGGYEKTRIADGMQAVDLMDRLAGHTDWVLVRPFPTYASSCVAPLYIFTYRGTLYNPGDNGGGGDSVCEKAYILGEDPVTNMTYTPNPTVWTEPLSNSPSPFPYAGQYSGFNPLDASLGHNNGEGFYKQLGGNELPNAPHWTATVTGDYTLPLANDWLLTLHSDVHWQSQSWWRVFNDSTYDKLHPYFTMNLAAIFANEDAGWNIMAYIKNVTDETAITGAFLNSDDTGLTTNVFLTEPRLYGLRVTKQWTGGPLLGTFGARHEGPYPFTVELGGQVSRFDAPTTALMPADATMFAAPLDIFDDAQRSKLDWGDARQAKLSWRPDASRWQISAAMRYGRTNKTTMLAAQQATPTVCLFGGPLASLCNKYNDPNWGPGTHISKVNRADADVIDNEDHTIIDFEVGRDVHLGNFGTGTVTGGVRYAQFTSSTRANLHGIPDWNIPEGFFYSFYQIYGPPLNHHTLLNIESDAKREFKGAGPTLSWEASHPLLDSGDAGKVSVDWSVSGGVLFGDQKTSVRNTETRVDFDVTAWQLTFEHIGVSPAKGVTTILPPVALSRSNRATVPTLAGSLGMAYQIGGFKVGAGYRWERYFNAIDGGYDQHRSYDRTVDGPYFKVAVGFGG